jgi:hypothetical protein
VVGRPDMMIDGIETRRRNDERERDQVMRRRESKKSPRVQEPSRSKKGMPLI